jgi:subtilisin-like proprotein convertase family protein
MSRNATLGGRIVGAGMDRLGYRIGVVALATVAFLLAGTGFAFAGGGTVFSYHDGPKAIPDGHDKAVFKLPVALIGSSMTVTDVNVNLRVNHPSTHDLTLLVQSPTGEKVTVSQHNTTGKNLGQGPKCPEEPLPLFPMPVFPDWTTLDDASGFPLSSGSAPYPDTYHPHRPLADFNGKQANGTWKLIAKDTKEGKKGSIQCAMLVIPFDYTP